eukprot:1861095-Rhodomonas_salina.7
MYGGSADSSDRVQGRWLGSLECCDVESVDVDCGCGAEAFHPGVSFAALCQRLEQLAGAPPRPSTVRAARSDALTKQTVVSTHTATAGLHGSRK